MPFNNNTIFLFNIGHLLIYVFFKLFLVRDLFLLVDEVCGDS